MDRYEDFKQALDDGKFVMAHRDGTVETEVKIKTEYQCVTRRFWEDLERQNKKPKEHAFGFFERFFTISG